MGGNCRTEHESPRQRRRDTRTFFVTMASSGKAIMKGKKKCKVMNVSSGVKINGAEGAKGGLNYSNGENCSATFNVIAKETGRERGRKKKRERERDEEGERAARVVVNQLPASAGRKQVNKKSRLMRTNKKMYLVRY